MKRCRCGFEGVELWFLNLAGPGFSFWCRGCQLGTSALEPEFIQTQRAPTQHERMAATKIGCTAEVYVSNLMRRRLHCGNCRKWKVFYSFPLNRSTNRGRDGFCRHCLSKKNPSGYFSKHPERQFAQ